MDYRAKNLFKKIEKVVPNAIFIIFTKATPGFEAMEKQRGRILKMTARTKEQLLHAKQMQERRKQ